MTNEEKHIEILAKAIYDDQLIPTLNIDEIKEFIKADNKGMLPSSALTALSLLQEECDKEKEVLQNTINFNVRANIGLVKTIDEQEKTITSLRAELEAVRMENERLKEYTRHYHGCELNSFRGRICTCGLDKIK